MMKILGWCVLVAAVIYGGDFLSWRFQIPSRPQFATVRLAAVAAVPRKDGKTEFLAEDPVDQTCVNSLFPHFGDPPCWYLNRHKNKRDNL